MKAVWVIEFGHTKGDNAGTVTERVVATSVGRAIASAKAFHNDDEGLVVIRAERTTELSK